MKNLSSRLEIFSYRTNAVQYFKKCWPHKLLLSKQNFATREKISNLDSKSKQTFVC